MIIPLVQSKRLILRSMTGSDAKPLHHIMGQLGVLQYFPNPTPPELDRVERLINYQLAHWEQYGYGWWAIESLEKGDRRPFIGWAGLQFLPETEEVEIAYMLDRDYWGCGLATEAAAQGLRYGFEMLEVKVIVGIVHPENAASIRVIEKLGMNFDVRIPYFGMDCFRYALTSEQFQAWKIDNPILFQDGNS